MSWQKILAQGFSTAKELLEFLSLPSHLGNVDAEKIFKTRVPRGFAARMQVSNPNDPLLLQVLAVNDELVPRQDFHYDPLAEKQFLTQKGVIQKYEGRILLTLTGVCAINCRFCFRRHFPYQENSLSRRDLGQILDYIATNPRIEEVILSGGDPLLASNKVINDLLVQLHQIKHLTTVRVHTRIPVVLPERIDEELLAILKSSSLRKIVVLHCNHPQELDETVYRACLDLHQNDCYLMNQSVLLKGVNDRVEVLMQLSKVLWRFGVLPYYLHLLDKVMGTAHFHLPEEEALVLYRELQKKLPGYLLPRLAREDPGKKSKTLLV